jgi:hypothetical protein
VAVGWRVVLVTRGRLLCCLSSFRAMSEQDEMGRKDGYGRLIFQLKYKDWPIFRNCLRESC